MIAVFAVVALGTDAFVVTARSVTVAHDYRTILHTRSRTLRFACLAREERTGAHAMIGTARLFAAPIAITLMHCIASGEQARTADVTLLTIVATHHIHPSQRPLLTHAFFIHQIAVNAIQCIIFQLTRPY